MSTRNKCLIAALVLLVLVGGGTALGRRGPPVIILTNESGEENLKAYFVDKRAAYAIDHIQPHSTLRFIPEMKHDSEMKIWIDRNKEMRNTAAPTHFKTTGGYCLKVAIQPDITVVAEAQANCFSIARLNPFAKGIPDGNANRLTEAKCKDLGGRVAGEENRKCTENEESHGKVWGLMCACICCVPKAS